MPRRATQPRDTVDQLTQRGDHAIGHAAAAMYSDGSLTSFGRPRPGMPAQAAPEALDVPLPMLGVSRQLAGKEAARLRAQAGRGRAELAGRYTFNWSGQQISDRAILNQRAELVAACEAATAEAERLDRLSDAGVREWARSRGVR
jgi:hypothetical protein